MRFLYPDERRFLFRFLSIFFFLFLLLFLFELNWLTRWIAGVETGLLNYVGVPASQEGSYILMGPYLVHIVPECTGLVMVFLLAALLYATRIPELQRRKALVVFTPFLLLFNLLRLLATLLVFYYWQALFGAVHVFLWFVDSALVLGLWYYVYRKGK